jgi:hypothetical protein
MRTILASVSCLFFATLLHAQLPVTSGSNSNPFLSDSNGGTIDGLRAAIVQYTYKWGGGNESIKFDAGGTGQHIGGTTHFKILWHVKSAQEIEITRADNRDSSAKARIKFSPDYKTFTGVDFGGGRPVNGFQIVPEAAAPAAGAPPGTSVFNDVKNTNDDLRKAIVKIYYSWEADGTKDKTIKFDANGTGLQSSFKFKWRITSPQQIEIVAEDSVSGKAKATLNFSPDYTSYTGTNFDGASPIAGHQTAQ